MSDVNSPRRRFGAGLVAGFVFAAAVAVVLSGGVGVGHASAMGCTGASSPNSVNWGVSGNAVWPDVGNDQSSGSSQTFTNFGGTTVDMTMTIDDPFNRNGDADNTLEQNPAVTGLTGWDPPVATETDGVYGAGYLTVAMNSEFDTEEVTFTLDFSSPVRIPDFTIGDIDAVGWGAQPDEPHDSFQDEIELSADRNGSAVGFDITPLGGSTPLVTGPNSVAGDYQAGVNGNLTPDDVAGTVQLETLEPITTMAFAYSNGPAETAFEPNGGTPPPAPLNAASNAVSNNHAVRVNVFVVCIGTLTVGDTVFADVDGDGVHDAGEPGIPGVTVELRDTSDVVVMTTTTDASGSYAFENVIDFDWRVVAVAPPGYTHTADRDASADGQTDVTLVAADVLDADFGMQPPGGVVSGIVYEDDDSSGDHNGGEAGIGGVTIDLDGTDLAGNSVNLSTTTLGDGTFAFSNVPAGVYSLTEVQPGSHVDGSESAGSNAVVAGDDDFSVTLGLGDSSAGNQFGETLVTGISGSVVDETAAGIGGVTVNLTGTTSLGDPVSSSTVTAGDGSFSFSGLAPGTYTLAEVQPVGYGDGVETVGTHGGDTATNDQVAAISLPGGSNATGYVFAETRSSIAGTVYDDTDGSASLTGPDAGIAGVTIDLSGTDDVGSPVSLSTVTAGDGTYSFAGLLSGNYTLTETQPGGYVDGADTIGSAGGTNAVNDEIDAIALSGGAAATGYDFGEIVVGSIAGTVYSDNDASGSLGVGDVGLSGVTIDLTGSDDQGPVALSTSTLGDGTYSFTGLRPGTYTLAETQPATYGDGAETIGTAGGSNAVSDVIDAIALTSGTAATGYDFGELPPSSIQGSVVDDAGNGIAGVTVDLSGTDSGGPVSASATTNPDGDYAFVSLLPGTYTVTETQPVGYGDGAETVGSEGGSAAVDDVISGIVLSADTHAVGYDFAETTGSIAGTVYDDVDASDSLTGGDTGIAGVTVTLTGTDAGGDPVNKTTVTSADGTYSFAALRGGTYTVTETQPAGYIDAAETVGSAGGTNATNDAIEAIVLGAAEDATGYDFGEVVQSTIAGRVIDDTGSGIGGVTVDLTGTTAGGPINLSTATAPDGTYSFDGLTPGTYTIVETQPTGYGDGVDTVGSEGGDASVDDMFSGIVLGPNVAAVDYVFAETTGSIFGLVFHDVNASGTFDPGDEPIAGVTVDLTGTDANGDPVVLTTITATDGDYLFDDLVGGTYTVAETQPAGFLDGSETAGSAGGDDNVDDVISAISLGGGVDAFGYDFGEVQEASLGGRVYVDADGSGSFEPGEPGIASVGVSLLGTDDVGNPVSYTTTTASDGSYEFTGLRPGTYGIGEAQPAGYGDGAETVGEAGGTIDTNDRVDGVTLASAQDASGYDFGEVLASIGGTVFHDHDGDGAQDDGEPGIGGVDVILTGTDALSNVVEIAVATNADGHYRFVDLLGGTYTLTEAQPDLYDDGSDTVGSAGGAQPLNDVIDAIDLDGGEAASGYDFAELGNVISGTVWFDRDEDGVIDAGEPGRLEGIALQLLDEDGVIVAETTTDADGNYAFPAVTAGVYTVIEAQPTGLATTTPNSLEVTVPIGGVSGVDFGEVGGSITGQLWDDDAGTQPGVHEETEAPIANVTVVLLDGTGQAVATTVTDVEGNYVFEDLVAGDYVVKIVPSDGDTLTTPDAGANDAVDSDFELIERTFPLTLQQGEAVGDVDAGIITEIVDVDVVIEVDDTSPTVGGPLTYEVIGGNAGNTPVNGVVVNVVLPPGVSINGITGDEWTCTTTPIAAGTEVECEYPETLLPGEQQPPLSIETTVVQAGTLDASIETTTGDGAVESTEDNNVDDVAVSVPAGSSGSGLARTGQDSGNLARLALLMVAVGLMMVLVGYRRRTELYI